MFETLEVAAEISIQAFTFTTKSMLLQPPGMRSVTNRLFHSLALLSISLKKVLVKLNRNVNETFYYSLVYVKTLKVKIFQQ